MEYVIGILLLASFFGLVVYAVRGGNLMMGIFVMAIIWTGLPMIGNQIVTNPDFIAANKDIISTSWKDALTLVFQSGPEGWGATLVNVVFGAWFGRVLMKTGIASTLIKSVTELGGDKPQITCILLCIVTTACFSSIFGAGAVVAIGVIVLPIFLSLGIPKVLATVAFMMSVGAGMYVNPVLYQQYSAFFLGDDGKTMYTYDMHTSWGIYALLIQVAVVIVLVLLLTRRKKVHTWGATTPDEVRARRGENAPGISLITPVLPVLLLIIFKVPIILGFVIGSFYAMITCKKIKGWSQMCRMINKDFFDGVVDTAPLVGFLLILPMFNKSAELCVPYFNALLGNVIPNNTLIISIAFAILSPLGLFRGPLTLFGCGAATLGILKGLGFSTAYLAPLMVIPSTGMNVSCCITQSWIVWGVNYTKVSTRDYLKVSAVAGWIVCAILQIMVYFMFG
ncbi:MAG: citrate transporter [Bilifractor sp.]|nr:citrate transporter [Lachnospiraceae bacterium]MDY2837516.1 citrate transporter [Bilifractor sp.]